MIPLDPAIQLIASIEYAGNMHGTPSFILNEVFQPVTIL